MHAMQQLALTANTLGDAPHAASPQLEPHAHMQGESSGCDSLQPTHPCIHACLWCMKVTTCATLWPCSTGCTKLVHVLQSGCMHIHRLDKHALSHLYSSATLNTLHDMHACIRASTTAAAAAGYAKQAVTCCSPSWPQLKDRPILHSFGKRHEEAC